MPKTLYGWQSGLRVIKPYGHFGQGESGNKRECERWRPTGSS
jgi:hypothetical protein